MEAVLDREFLQAGDPILSLLQVVGERDPAGAVEVAEHPIEGQRVHAERQAGRLADEHPVVSEHCLDLARRSTSDRSAEAVGAPLCGR